jgi:UPF0271 protein
VGIVNERLLNIDLGEIAGEPDELYAIAHVANIACGGHAGDAASMARAVALCVAHGTRVGAHPSYPDREGFGRRRLPLAPDAMRERVAEQCGALAAIARSAGVAVAFVKAHGALYHAANGDTALARAVVDGAIDALGTAITFIGPPRGEVATAAARSGLAFAREGFADRATRPDGSLVPRDQPGALVLDPAAAAARARALADSGGGDTICVHGDTPGAVAIARAVRAALDARTGG